MYRWSPFRKEGGLLDAKGNLLQNFLKYKSGLVKYFFGRQGARWDYTSISCLFQWERQRENFIFVAAAFTGRKKLQIFTKAV